MPKVLTILGTRPEIIKLSPLIPLLVERCNHVLVHSGQHYSYDVDAIFFQELNLPAPHHALGVGSASHGEQTARILARLEPILFSEQPDAVLVQGDTNTTLGGALCASKLGIPVVHLEAGGRSFNRAMPEEQNRIIVDHISALLLAADAIATTNLRNEGLPEASIATIGSTAIDAVLRNREHAQNSTILEQFELREQDYLLLTLHRAENTIPSVLPGMVEALNELAEAYTIVFPVHPRTDAALKQQGLTLSPKLCLSKPLGYLDTLRLIGSATAVLTDSGGLQEEAGVLQTPLLITRNETEWRYLVDAGSAVLIGNRKADMLAGAATWLAPAGLAQLRAHPAPVQAGAAEQAAEAILKLIARA
ncbi:non-hydrolyzing UDP-N-acetylglucosamine 2-epimerase [Candidatus Viridilinea mediisalina]|uniref:UDP-N-acetylglucosamine 2-epimerase (Non-hydrolyzing) n=1 Tax=Candidatus Viridilinea mediisalina TaxID=2024553 RepID=A0A2A6RN46_9CHLR|nr:UDP-N-acetylglucosamine 2-epimerase (non-hydrolyzing) [Candidatus Viridilinea mediisalina]PDW04373.1 UDP-N-acetylglucosamine 2-epimerase (non-hydrolyzing) [Candidatus Viridilinea mediisalina]